MRPNQREIAKCGRPLCVDRDTETDLIARRNILTGLWAARVLRLPLENHAAYAWSVHFADFEQPGDEDILGRLVMNMKRGGVAMSYRRLRRELRENELRAFFQIALVYGRAPEHPRTRASRGEAH